MRTLMTVVAFAALACGIVQTRQSDGPADVKVFLNVDDPSSARLVRRAVAIADSMFAAIGVRVEWATGRIELCSTLRHKQPVVIRLRIVGLDQKNHPLDTVAYSLPFARGVKSITVMYDRLETTIQAWPQLGPSLLAHVFVHEITHVLQRTNAHAETGVMKARWTQSDYVEMSRRPLPFTPQDVELIRQGLDALESYAGWHALTTI